MIDNISNSYVVLELPVQCGDMDAAQHVNNTVYLRWIESARIEMFQKMHKGDFKFKKGLSHKLNKKIAGACPSYFFV